MTCWSVYYDDGSVISQDTPVENTPGRGVLVIAQVLNGEAYVRWGHDFWWWDGRQWWGADLFGLFDQLSLPGWKKVLFGRTVSNEQFGEVTARAMRDFGLIEVA